MKQADFEYETSEYFEIILESENHSIKSTELISVLHNYRQLLKGVNFTLNKKYTIGYENVDFDVVALEEGSFKIPICIKKSANSLAITTIGGILSGLFLLKSQSFMVHTPVEDVEVKKEELMESNDTKKAVVNIAKTAVESDGISGLSLNYTKEDGSIENVRIEKTQLEPIASIYTEVESEIQTNICEIKLVIVAPVLDDKKVNWKFRTQSGVIISAKMDDDEFLEKLGKEHIAFGKNDVLHVELETKIKTNEDGLPKPTYSVIKVIDYPRYKKNNILNQASLEL